MAIQFVNPALLKYMQRKRAANSGGGTPIPTPGTVIISDDFHGMDGSIDGRVTPVGGKTWEVLNGASWSIQSNQVQNTSVGADGYALVVLDCGLTDNYAVQADVTLDNTPGHYSTSGLAIRATDADNYDYLQLTLENNTLYFDKVEGGTANDTGFWAVDLNGQANMTVRIEVVGDVMSIFLNGVYYNQATDSFNNTATKVGLFGFAIPGDRWKNFQVETL